jgi:alpha-tubulin suppressor-like RCC1 family protein
LKDEFLNEIKLLYVFGDAINKNNVLIVTHDDKVFAFGDNEWGVLGFGNNRKVNELTFNEELSHKQIIDFKNDDKHVIALTIDGKVYCWGFYGLFSDLGNEKNGRKINKPQLNMYLRDEKIVDISCGSDHTIVLTNCGEVYAWGWNDWGQVGNVKIDYFEYQAKPIKVNGFNEEKVVMISCGCSHSMALTESGHVFSWGENEFGQLGLNSTDDANEPLILLLSNEIPIKKISCGSNHSLLLSRDGDIY